MGVNTKIGWTDHSINFWKGCHKVSDGCKFCYMYRDYGERWKNDANVVSQVKESTVAKVLKMAQPGDRIFTCSWSDFFIEEADTNLMSGKWGWRHEAWKVIKSRPDLIWQILTKRPDRIEDSLPDDWGAEGYENVWLGTSIESDKYRDRLLDLHSIKTRSSKFKTFVSYEPALGFLDLLNDGVVLSSEFERLDWVIVGGESGNETGKFTYRPCELSWLEGMVRQCRDAKIPVFVKQLGTHLAKLHGCKDRHGADFSEFPDSLKFQQFPK